MKKLYLLLFIFLVKPFYSQKNDNSSSLEEEFKPSSGYIDKSPSCFINKGQWESSTLALAKTKGLYTRFHQQGFDWNYFTSEYQNHLIFDRSFPPQLTYQQKGHVVRIEQLNGNFNNNNLVIHKKKPTQYNYLTSAGMIKDVPAANDFTYKNVYPGIDMHWYFDTTYTYFEYIVNSGADVSTIQWQIKGADNIYLTKNNEVVLLTQLGELKLKGLKAYQVIHDKKINIPIQWVLNQRENINYLTFHVGEYNTNYPLVIDPYVWGAVIGGSSSGQMEQMRGVKCREFSEEFYSVGFTHDIDFPVTPGAYDITSDGSNLSWDGVACYFKVDTVSNYLLSCTYLSGSGSEASIAVDMEQGTRRVFILGGTNSTDFPVTANAPQNIIGGSYDNFIIEMTPLLDSLVFSTFWGGSNEDLPYNLKYQNNRVYFTGQTNSNNFPVTINNVQNSNNGLNDGIISCIDLSNHQVFLSTYLGGTDNDYLYGIDVRANGEIAVCGRTYSSDFPMSSNFLYNTFNLSDDGIIAILDPLANTLLFTTYFGGNNFDEVNDVRFFNDTLIFGGMTNSTNLPLQSNFGSFPFGMNDGFMGAIRLSTPTLLFSDYFGGTGDDFIAQIDICGIEQIVFCGYSFSTDYITVGFGSGSYTPTTAFGFYQKMNKDLTQILQSDVVDGDNIDIVYDIDANWHSQVALAGYTTSNSVFYVNNDPFFGGPANLTAFDYSYQGVGPYNGLLTYSYGCFHSFPIHILSPAYQLTCYPPAIDIDLTNFGYEVHYWNDFINYGPIINGVDSCQQLGFIANLSNKQCARIGYVTIHCNNTPPDLSIGTNDSILRCSNNFSTTIFASTSSAQISNFVWSGGNPSAGGSINTINVPGNYTATLTNLGNGCTSSASIYIGIDSISPGVSAISLNNFTELNCNFPSLDLLAVPDTNYVTYQWSNGDNDSLTSVILPGTYTVTATNIGNGCTGSASIDITSDFTIPIPSIQTENNQFEINCAHPVLTVEAEGGKYYTWSGNLPADSIVNISTPGIYTVTVSGDNGCTSTTNVIITSNFTPPPAFIISLDNNYALSCKNPEITLLAQQGVSYSWQPNVSNSYIAYVNQPGNYVVTVTGANGCTATAQVSILDNTGTVELFWIDTIRPTCYANDGKLSVGVSQGDAPYQYTWNSSPNNTNTINNIPPGYYWVIVTDAAGCKDTLQIDFTCKLPDNNDNNGNDTTNTGITIINLITPNDDGTNDSWVIPEIDQYPNNKVSILNRWGDEIFRAQPYQNNWSGQSNTGMVVGGNKVTSGVYFYVIDLGNGTLPLKGYLVLEY